MSGAGLAGHRFLVADDEPDYVEYLCALLSAHGARHIDRALCGDDALDRLASGTPYDLVLTDHRMPAPSGLQLVAMAREAGYRGGFLMVTAFPDADLEGRIERIDDVELLGKPFDPHDLIARVERLLQPIPPIDR